jgi:uncharacterized protein YecA (UPF0149 family)
LACYFAAAHFSPNGFDFEQWKDAVFEDASRTAAVQSVKPGTAIDRFVRGRQDADVLRAG